MVYLNLEAALVNKNSVVNSKKKNNPKELKTFSTKYQYKHVMKGIKRYSLKYIQHMHFFKPKYS